MKKPTKEQKQKVEELVERVRLTDEKIIACQYDAKGIPQKDVFRKVAQAQLNEVLNDPDLTLIDRGKLPALNEEHYLRKGYYLIPKNAFFVIPLAEALKEMHDETMVL